MLDGKLALRSIVVLAIGFLPMGVSAELLLFGGRGHDVFLGCFDCSRYDSGSICNKYGDHGSKYNSDSIWNKYGDYGSKYNSSSPWNKYSTDNSVPVLVDRDGNFYGYFTINKFRSDAIDNARSLQELYEAADGDLEIIRDAMCE